MTWLELCGWAALAYVIVSPFVLAFVLAIFWVGGEADRRQAAAERRHFRVIENTEFRCGERPADEASGAESSPASLASYNRAGRQ